jgi:glycosyltransferase involved in cell wall biosynthesis
MTTRTPTLSIGLPVYNGEAYLASALDALLAQSYEDFELIVCDNASTDETEAIVRSAAACDERVRYVRASHNQGAITNFNDAFLQAHGRYFKWAADDDLMAPEFVGSCIAELERDPGVVLCHSNTHVIDGEGRVVGDYAYAPGYARDPRPSRRFADVLREDRWCLEIYGVIRADVLRETALMRRYVGSDRGLLAELALHGRFVILPDYLFSNRDHPARAVRRFPTHQSRAALEDPAMAGRRLLPHWRILGEYLRTVRDAEISAAERRRCRLELVRWAARRRNWARLASDPLIAMMPSIGPVLARLADSEQDWLAGRIRRAG